MVDTHTGKILGFIGATYLRSITLKTFHTFHKHPTPNHLSHQKHKVVYLNLLLCYQFSYARRAVWTYYDQAHALQRKHLLEYYRYSMARPHRWAPEPARVRAIRVTFEPAARTAWHTHPLGQTLYVLNGTGLVGLRGQPPKIINAGDTVWIPPHKEHWHGATATNSMCHLAISRKS